MQIAERPKPVLAMLQGEVTVLRSLINPFDGFAWSQKYWQAPCCRVSSNASSVMAAAGEAMHARPSIARRMRFMTAFPASGVPRRRPARSVTGPPRRAAVDGNPPLGPDGGVPPRG